MKNKKDKKSRIIIAMMLGCIILCSASVTFSIAWYAADKRLVIDGIEVTVDDYKELLISIDDENFYSRIPIEKDTTNSITTRFLPVSSIYSEIEDDKPVFYEGDQYSLDRDPSKPSKARDGYFQQEIYLKSNSNVLATIDIDKTFFEANERKNEEFIEEYPSYDGANNLISAGTRLEQMNKLRYSMRYSLFVPSTNGYYIVDPLKEDKDNYSEDTYFGGILDTSLNNIYYYDTYIKDNKEYEVLYGDVNDRDLIVYDEPSSSDGDSPSTLNGFNAIHKANAYTFNYEKSIENGLIIAKEKSYGPSDLNSETTDLLIPLKKDISTKVVLSIYMEGWDRDCINSTMGASFNSYISFKIARDDN